MTRSCRDFLSLLLVLALVLGTAPRVAASTEMQCAAPASNLINAIVSDVSMLGLCDKCAKSFATHACFGACVGSTQAILSAAGFAPIRTNMNLAPFIEQLFSGSDAPPSLPPPKLSDLS